MTSPTAQSTAPQGHAPTLDDIERAHESVAEAYQWLNSFPGELSDLRAALAAAKGQSHD